MSGNWSRWDWQKVPRVRRYRQSVQEARRHPNGGTVQGSESDQTDIKNKGPTPKREAIAETERKITKKNWYTQIKMAFSRKNMLFRVKEVNELYVEKAKIGLTTEFIYRTFIKPRFHISRSTLYEYLAIPYDRQLKEIYQREKAEKEQNPTLF